MPESSRKLSSMQLWRRLVEDTAQYPEELAAAYLALGLAGEAGEVANIVKKYVRKYENTEMLVDKNGLADKLLDEIGDVLWYVHAIIRNQGWTEQQVFEHTNAKLRGRLISDTIKAVDHSTDHNFDGTYCLTHRTMDCHAY